MTTKRMQTEDGSILCLTIQDNGAGFQEDQLELLNSDEWRKANAKQPNVLWRRLRCVTGILIIGIGAIVGNSPILNIFLYGASVYACLSSNIVTLIA